MSEILPGIFILIFAFSIFPTIAFGIANNAESDDQFLAIFKRLDSATYFQDNIIVRYRQKYEAEYRDRLKQTIWYVTVLLLAIVFLVYADHLIQISESNQFNLGVMVGLTHSIGSIFIFGRLGASEARLSATRPISDIQRKEMERIILESPDSKFLIEFMNQNVKSTIAYVDVLNLKFQAKKIKARIEEQKRQDTLSSLNR